MPDNRQDVANPKTLSGTGHVSNSGTNVQHMNVNENGTISGQEMHYECPLYRTSARYGVLKTNGHSSNFIIMINTPLPQDVGDAESRSVTTMGGQRMTGSERCTSNHWIKRGAAMLCSLSN